MALDGRLTVEVDEAVDLSFAATNVGDDPVELVFPDGLVVDFAVSDGETEVWRWSDGRMFTQAVRTEVVEPGESVAREATWNPPGPGAYAAEATLAARGIDLSERVEVEV